MLILPVERYTLQERVKSARNGCQIMKSRNLISPREKNNQTKGGEMKNNKFWFGLLMGFCLGVILMLMLIDIIGLI